MSVEFPWPFRRHGALDVWKHVFKHKRVSIVRQAKHLQPAWLTLCTHDDDHDVFILDMYLKSKFGTDLSDKP